MYNAGFYRLSVRNLKLTPSLCHFNLMFPGEKKRADLLEAAEEVGDSIHHLVEAVRANDNTH